MAKSFRLPLSFKEKVGRAVHDFSLQKRFTMHPMLLYPAYGRVMKRGEEFKFSTPQLLLQSMPTHSPVMGNFRLRIEWYFNSFANHYGWIDNNTRLTAEESLNRRHHTYEPRFADIVGLSSVSPVGGEWDYDSFISAYGTGKGSVMDFMGVPPGWIPPFEIDEDDQPYYVNGHASKLNLDFILTYLNIIRCYHTNQQFPEVPYVFTLTAAGSSENEDANNYDQTDYFRTYSQSDLDKLFMALRYLDNGLDLKYDVSGDMFIPTDDGKPLPDKYVDVFVKFGGYLKHCFEPNGGLFCCQYAPDLYRNLLPKDQALLESKITIGADGSFSITEFRYANRLQKIYERINPFGGKDSTISRTRWGITSNRDYDIPELICVQTEVIDTTNITSSNAGVASFDGESISSIPGEMSGKVDQRKFIKSKHSFKAETPGMLMAIVSLVPMVDYCENLERELTYNMFEDEFSPQMANIGFEDVPLSDYFALPGYRDVSNMEHFFEPLDPSLVVGRQVKWLRDMTAVNRVHGEFVRHGLYRSWVLSRDYKRSVVDNAEDGSYHIEPFISPYGSPVEWQYPFVGQNLSYPNWFIQIAFNIKSISPVGYRFMPTLE